MKSSISFLTIIIIKPPLMDTSIKEDEHSFQIKFIVSIITPCL